HATSGSGHNSKSSALNRTSSNIAEGILTIALRARQVGLKKVLVIIGGWLWTTPGSGVPVNRMLVDSVDNRSDGVKNPHDRLFGSSEKVWSACHQPGIEGRVLLLRALRT